MHCSKGAQPVPKAKYRSGHCDKHKAVVSFDPGTSHTAVEYLSTRPALSMRPACSMLILLEGQLQEK